MITLITGVPGSGFQHTAARRRLVWTIRTVRCIGSFNTQPPEGGWVNANDFMLTQKVSTHSRPKAAGPLTCN